MAIRLDLEEYHVRQLGKSGGLLNLSHHDHRDYKIAYHETDSVYDMWLGVFFDEDDRLPAISLKGRIVQRMIFEILDNVSRKHLEHIVTWANNKLERNGVSNNGLEQR